MGRRCERCGARGLLFRCRYCGRVFCAEHHFPPNHSCVNIAAWRAKPPPGITIRFKVWGGASRHVVYSSVDVPASGELGFAGEKEEVEVRIRRAVALPSRGRLGQGRLALFWASTFLLSLALLMAVTQSFKPVYTVAAAFVATIATGMIVVTDH